MFSWASFGPGVHTLVMRPAPPAQDDLVIDVFTSETQAKVPDLSAFRIARPSADWVWAVGARSDITSVDELASFDLPLLFEPPAGERSLGVGTTQGVFFGP